MNPGEAFGPGTAKELGKDGFGLVIEGVRGGDGVEWGVAEKLAEPGVAEAPGSAFDGVGGQITMVGWRGSHRSTARFGRGVDAGLVEGDAEV